MIQLEKVIKVFDSPAAAGRGRQRTARGLDGLTLSVVRGEIVCVIGPSGCGKTTALRAINRLVVPTSGRVLVGGEDVAAQDAVRLRRGIGYVIQNGGLFPHMSVERNVGLVCELEGWEAARVRERVWELLARVQLDPAEFASRAPKELSGGQRQRVGVARALALEPPVLLMDEPFGALDPATRRRLQREFLELRDPDRTTVIVTHDVEEAFLLGDRVAFLSAGKLVQVGTRHELTSAPATPELRDFLEGAR